MTARLPVDPFIVQPALQPTLNTVRFAHAYQLFRYPTRRTLPRQHYSKAIQRQPQSLPMA
ncbi:MAG: hypothetical protein ACYDBJ_24065 [Aggregatilineales bacterium]